MTPLKKWVSASELWDVELRAEIPHIPVYLAADVDPLLAELEKERDGLGCDQEELEQLREMEKAIGHVLRGYYRENHDAKQQLAKAEARAQALQEALKPFTFPATPESFHGTDADVTSVLICDSDVQRARLVLDTAKESPQ